MEGHPKLAGRRRGATHGRLAVRRPTVDTQNNPSMRLKPLSVVIDGRVCDTGTTVTHQVVPRVPNSRQAGTRLLSFGERYGTYGVEWEFINLQQAGTQMFSLAHGTVPSRMGVRYGIIPVPYGTHLCGTAFTCTNTVPTCTVRYLPSRTTSGKKSQAGRWRFLCSAFTTRLINRARRGLSPFRANLRGRSCSWPPLDRPPALSSPLLPPAVGKPETNASRGTIELHIKWQH